jgi:hypothetical protein
VCVEGFEVCYAGGVHIEQHLSKMVMEDSQRAISKLVPHIPKYKHDIPSKVIEDVKVRTLFVMQLPQKKEYFGLPKDSPSKEQAAKYLANLEKMKASMT